MAMIYTNPFLSPYIIFFPSKLKLTDMTHDDALRVALTSSVWRDISLQVLSPDPVNKYLQFAENLQHSTASLCPSIDEVHLVAG